MQFYCIGGSQNQSVSGVTTICLTQCNTFPLHRVDQVVDCGNSTHLYFYFFTINVAILDEPPILCYDPLCEVAGYRQELEHSVVYAGESGEYADHARTGMFSASRN